MLIDPAQLVLQFTLTVAFVWCITVAAVKLYRFCNQPRGTYANGQPERRKRKRLVLPDPAALQPRPVAPGQMI